MESKSPKRVRIKLTLKEKYDIIKEIENGEQREDVRRKHKLKHRSNIKSILDNKEKIISAFESKTEKLAKKSSYVRNSDYPDIEESFIVWMRQMRAKKIPLSVEIISTKAKQFAELLKHPECM